MNVVVMGAGAVGCYFGGLLARAGHDVMFVGRQAHAEAITSRGLMLEIGGKCTAVPARGATDTSALGHADLILVAVKSADTESAGAQSKPLVASRTAILSLQNGVDNADRLGAIIGHDVIPTVVYVGVEMAGPGHVRHHGRGDIVIGSTPRSADIAATFQAAGIPTTVSQDIRAALWTKLITNCAYNALSAAGHVPYGEMVEVPGVPAVMSSVIRECVAVADASGVMLPADIEARTLALTAAMPKQYSSTAQDLARGKPTEIDFLNGFVVRQGAALGVPTPANQTLQAVIKLMERRRTDSASATDRV